jgi:hypothetical protein
MYAAACSSPCISMHAGGARARPAAAAGAAAWAAHRGALALPGCQGPCAGFVGRSCSALWGAAALFVGMEAL